MQPRRFRVVATVERRAGNKTEIIRTHTITRNMSDPDLIADLTRYWGVTCELADINHATPLLAFHRDDRARPVRLRVPPYKPDELPEDERATTILEALRKMTAR
jgi:hypothetical protein